VEELVDSIGDVVRIKVGLTVEELVDAIGDVVRIEVRLLSLTTTPVLVAGVGLRAARLPLVPRGLGGRGPAGGGGGYWFLFLFWGGSSVNEDEGEVLDGDAAAGLLEGGRLEESWS
jgi:hypothetical protein